MVFLLANCELLHTPDGISDKTPTIDSYSIKASTITSFGALQAPYTQPAAKTVTITNTGTGAITLIQPSAVNYLIGTLSKTSLAATGETAAFTVQPKAGLAAGTYNETITINGTNDASATISVAFTVTPAVSYLLTASALTSFGSLQAPYTQPPAQTVTVTNTGTGALKLNQPVSDNYIIGTLSSTNLSSNGGTATFTVRPKVGLTAGTYNETITISGTNGASTSVTAMFEVTPAVFVLSYSISASTLASFGSLQTPYTQPAAKIVTITSTGTGSVTLAQPTAINYLIGTLSKTSLAATGETATFTVQPKAGLAVGTYNETITINGTNGASTTVSAMFTVTAASDNRDRVVKSLKVSAKASPTNIVFLGDGFVWDDNNDGGLFDAKVAELSNYIFSIKPFSTYQDYFSVYSVSAVSANQGAKANPTDTTPSTVFNSTYNYMNTDRLLVARNTSAVREYARLATPNPHIIVVIVNDSKYGGSGGEFAVTSVNSSAKEIVIHEIGHIFSLADEYVDEAYRQAAGITITQAKAQPNLDTTNNLSQIKWSHFIGLPGYTDSAWEGGYYFATGVWRPTENSIMRSYAIMEYNAISRETIVKKIIANAGEKYNLDDFLVRDVPPAGLKMMSVPSAVLSGSDNPMPVPVDVYAESLYGGEKIRARFVGEE